jgi:hypothetical protein
MRLKDYKKKSPNRDIVKRDVKPRYFLLGLMSGILLSFGLIFTDIGERFTNNIRVKMKNIKVSDFIPENRIKDIFGGSSLPPVEFDFYDQKPVGEGTPPSVNGAVTFQTGSFKLKEDAERVRSVLSASDIDSRIEVVSIESIGLLHRVLVGPLVGDALIIDTRIKILDAGIVPLTLKTELSP